MRDQNWETQNQRSSVSRSFFSVSLAFFVSLSPGLCLPSFLSRVCAAALRPHHLPAAPQGLHFCAVPSSLPLLRQACRCVNVFPSHCLWSVCALSSSSDLWYSVSSWAGVYVLLSWCVGLRMEGGALEFSVSLIHSQYLWLCVSASLSRWFPKSLSALCFCFSLSSLQALYLFIRI